MIFWKRSLDTATTQYQAVEEMLPVVSPMLVSPKHAWDVNLWLDWDDPEDPPGALSLRACQWAIGTAKKP